ALAELIVACVAQAALDHDDKIAAEHQPGRLIEENLWRAIRYGLDGEMIDLDRGELVAAASIPDHLLAWTEPARSGLKLDPALPERNGAQRQGKALREGASMAEAYAAEVETARRTYAGGAVAQPTGR
ncbi:MAG: carboxylate-amine ligase, partial [Thermoleophilaceae bacterium]